MVSLSAWFENLLFGGAAAGGLTVAASNKKVVTVIGSGGKTSLIWRLAASLAEPRSRAAAKTAVPIQRRRILVSPTTKMFVPEKHFYDFYYNGHDHNVKRNADALSAPLPGITLAGLFNEASGKLESIPLRGLENIISRYDLVLIEGDGSRGLPLKAWAENEPVVPDFTDLTIGVLPLWPLGKPVSEELVHRLPLFCSLTGAAPGEHLRQEHILALITGRTAPGLFAKARGEKILFFNQVEDGNTLQQAWELAGRLTSDLRLNRIIAGSIRNDEIDILDVMSQNNKAESVRSSDTIVNEDKKC